MPTVPYQAYPTVPTIPTPTGPLSPPQQIPAATPAAFGAQVGQKLEQLGDIGMRGASELAEAAVRQQEFQNANDAQNAQNRWAQRTQALLFGNPADPSAPPGIYQLKGADAAERGKTIQQDLDRVVNEEAAGLNPRARLQFLGEVRRMRFYENGNILRHLDQQQFITAGAIQKAAEDQASRDAGLYWNDDNKLNEAIESAQDAATKRAQATSGFGATPQVLEDARKVAKANVIESAMNAAMGAGNNARAQAIVDANPGVLTGEQQERVIPRLRSSWIQQGTREITAGVVGAGGDLWNKIKTKEHGIGPNGEALVSPAGAVGISQILPSTAKTVADELGVPFDEQRLHTDQAYNEMLGRRYLQDMLERYGGNPVLASAAYNAGPQRVDEWIGKFGDPRTGEITNADWAARIPNTETNDYVKSTGLVAGAAGTGASLEKMEDMGRAQATAFAAHHGFNPDMTEQLIEHTLSNIRGQYNITAAAARSTEQANLNAARAAVLGHGPGGEPYHTLGDFLDDPARRSLYDALKPNDQLAIRHQIETEATHVPLTPERMQRWAELDGMRVADPAAFMAIDPLKEDLPIAVKQQLIRQQDDIQKGMQQPFDTIKAFTTIKNLGLLENTGIDAKLNPPLFHQFMSALNDAGNQFKADKKRLPNPEELRVIASDLLKVVIPGGWFSGDTHAFETMVPTNERNDIVKAYTTQFGRPPSPNQILQIYHYQQEHGIGSNQATAEIPSPEGVSVP